MFSFLQKTDFYQMLFQQTQKTEEGINALAEFMRAHTKENGEKVNHLEEEADELRRMLVDKLNRTFVTPIDREDIFGLSSAIDDVIDYAKSTVEEMLLFEVAPDERIAEMVLILQEAMKDISDAVKNMKDYPQACMEHLVRAKKAENKVERRYRQALVELFKTKDVITILKTREIYRHISNAADRVVAAANIIGDIIVKHS